MPTIELKDLLVCLDVREIERDVYTGPNLELPYYRIFGGQLLAQTIAVAEATEPDKTVKSLHVVFPREGQVADPVSFKVARSHSGRTFATQQIVAAQGSRIIMAATLVLHAPEHGEIGHQATAPRVTAPQDLEAVDLGLIPWETRPVEGGDLADPAVAPAEYYWWMRVDADLPDDAGLHKGLLAHATDLTLIGTELRPAEGLSQADSTRKLQTAVVSHTLWFHGPVDMACWQLVSQEGVSLAGARGFGRGDVFDSEGGLVASFAQESMIRAKQPE